MLKNKAQACYPQCGYKGNKLKFIGSNATYAIGVTQESSGFINPAAECLKAQYEDENRKRKLRFTACFKCGRMNAQSLMPFLP